MKPSYASALSANAAEFPPPPEPSPLFPPITAPTPPVKHCWGSFKIDLDDIITKAFTIPPPNPTIAWVLMRNTFFDHPDWIEVLSPPHQNAADDALHLSLKVWTGERKQIYSTIHINGRLSCGYEFGSVSFWNETMDIQMSIKCGTDKGLKPLRETIADWTSTRRPRGGFKGTDDKSDD